MIASKKSGDTLAATNVRSGLSYVLWGPERSPMFGSLYKLNCELVFFLLTSAPARPYHIIVNILGQGVSRQSGGKAAPECFIKLLIFFRGSSKIRPLPDNFWLFSELVDHKYDHSQETSDKNLPPQLLCSEIASCALDRRTLAASQG